MVYMLCNERRIGEGEGESWQLVLLEGEIGLCDLPTYCVRRRIIVCVIELLPNKYTMYSKVELILHAVAAIYILVCHRILLFVLSLLPKTWLSYYESKEPVSSNLSNKVVIVTGSNTGIGKAIALQLAALGAQVVLAVRNEQKGNEAENEINSDLKLRSSQSYPYAKYGKAKCILLDMSDLHSILDFAVRFKKEYSRLDILVCNAGLNEECLLPNGLEQLFQINYLGHYLLVRSLEDILRKLPDTDNFNAGAKVEAARVINLSSVMHHCGQANFKISALRKYTMAMSIENSYYNDSKLYMNLLTLEINKRFSAGFATVTSENNSGNIESSSNIDTSEVDGGFAQNLLNGAVNQFSPDSTKGNSTKFGKQLIPQPQRPIIAISANPGAVRSDIWRNMPFKFLWNIVTKLLFLDVHQGAATSVYAAVVDEVVLSNYRCEHPRTVEGGKMCMHGDIPYLVPYSMPVSILALEILGPFAGPRFAAVSLPVQSNEPVGLSKGMNLSVNYTSPQDLSAQLWSYSAELCRKILVLSGVHERDLEFLVEGK